MTLDQEHELLSVAREAAQAAAAELRAGLGRHAPGVRAKSTPTDLVSDVDISAESKIRQVLSRRRPQDAVLGEEGGATGKGELRWVVDPLDGTVNYLFGIPVFAVSVACEDADGVVCAVVLDPVRDECFEATRSGEATLNAATIHASGCDDLSKAMIATGFGYDAAVRARQADVLARVLPRVRDIRRAGAASIDLAWCACGRYDGYYERGIHHWDVAAGGLICDRAGLELRSLSETGEDPWGLVVAPPSLMDELLELVGH